jgi:hypothetical protein
MMTPEAKAKLFAELDAEFGRRRLPKPKVVAEEGRIVRDVDVQVSPADYNFRGSGPQGFVRIDYAAYERQRAFAEEDARREAKRRREIDPFDYGHWNKD